jgi:peroxiredoxin
MVFLKRLRPAGIIAAITVCFFLAHGIALGADDDVQSSINKVQPMLNSAQYEEALKELRGAEKKATGAEVFAVEWNLAQAYAGLGDTKKAAQSCERAIAAAPDDTAKARAHNLKGRIYTGDHSSKKELSMGEAEFRAAIQLAPNFAAAHFDLGQTLLRENDDPDGIAELKAYLDEVPNGEEAKRARAMIANPARAKGHFSPDFSFTTMEGQQISSDSFRGKVVLLEFWASWCPPCQASAPSLAHLYREHAKDKDRFEFVSISVDQDEAAWQHFVEKHHLEWVQARDAKHDVIRRFFGEGRQFYIPTYFVIGGDGAIVGAHDDWSPSMEAVLNDDINKALKQLPATPAESAQKN